MTDQPQAQQCQRCGEVNPAEIHTCTPLVAEKLSAWAMTDDGNDDNKSTARHEFEHIFDELDFARDHDLRGRAQYEQPHVQSLWQGFWQGWQARGKQSSPKEAGKPQGTKEMLSLADVGVEPEMLIALRIHQAENAQPSAAGERELPKITIAMQDAFQQKFMHPVNYSEYQVAIYAAKREGFYAGYQAALTGAAPADANAGGKWMVFHNGKSVTAETWSKCMAAARQLRTPEENVIAASNLAAAIAANAAEEAAEQATMLTATMPRITAEEMAAFSRFCECCEDFDSGGHDVDKNMMKRLACIGLVRACGFGRYETTLFGDEVRSDSTSTPTAPEVSADVVKDAEDEFFTQQQLDNQIREEQEREESKRLWNNPTQDMLRDAGLL